MYHYHADLPCWSNIKYPLIDIDSILIDVYSMSIQKLLPYEICKILNLQLAGYGQRIGDDLLGKST